MKKRIIRAIGIPGMVLLMSFNSFGQCNEVNVNQLTTILKGLIEPTISIKLDRRDSRLSLMGATERFEIPHQDISKVANDWRYWVNDLRSDDSNFWFDKNNRTFVLDVRFEGDGSEIKGECPGCRLGNKDRRAPDINWKGARIARLRLRPIVYGGSISVQVDDVQLFGEFDLNGFLEAVFPRMVRNMEARIKRDIEAEANEILNNSSIRRTIASRMQPLLSSMGIRSVSRIEFTGDGTTIRVCD